MQLRYFLISCWYHSPFFWIRLIPYGCLGIFMRQWQNSPQNSREFLSLDHEMLNHLTIPFMSESFMDSSRHHRESHRVVLWHHKLAPLPWKLYIFVWISFWWTIFFVLVWHNLFTKIFDDFSMKKHLLC